MPSLKVPVTERDHYQGQLTAPIQLVEYGDYQCPYCGSAYLVLKDIQNEFADQLCFIFRNFPLSQLHEHALSAALVAEFAARHNQFWPVHDMLFENQNYLGLPLYTQIAKQFGFNEQELMQALENRTDEPRVLEDFNGGVRSGVNGTPTLFINGVRYNQGVEYDSLKMTLDAVLLQKNKQ